MAVDDRDKRTSATEVTIPWRNRYPNADGTVGAPDRLHATNLYAGIAADSPPAPGTEDPIILQAF